MSSVAMASSEQQPLKKRKLYESLPAVVPPSASSSSSSSPPSQDEILQKRRNREEIRNVYECYRRIRYFVSQKDPNLMLSPDFEQSYLSLITASRGCTSAQRIAAELIPRYAPYCPTALEAAAKVSINMYNWSLAIIARGDDFDGVAFETAKSCVFGLVDICSTASSEAPTSSVIQGICSAVFLNVLSFFVSSFGGKDIYQIDLGIIEKVKLSKEMFSELKVDLADENEPAMSKLFNFRAVCLLRIFFLCPRNLLVACFELLSTSGSDIGAHKGALYFIRQVTSQLSTNVVSQELNVWNDVPMSCMDSQSEGSNVAGEEKLDSNYNLIRKGFNIVTDCFFGMVVVKDSSLRGWLFSRYKKLLESVGSEAISELSSYLEGVFDSCSELVCDVPCHENSEEYKLDNSIYVNQQYLAPRISGSGESSGWESSSKEQVVTAGNVVNEDRAVSDKAANYGVMPCHSLTKREASVSESSNHECESSAPVKESELGEKKDSCSDRRSMRMDSFSSLLPSASLRDLRSDSFQSSIPITHLDKNQVSSSTSSSPKQHLTVQPRSHSTGRIVWYSDGDPAAMDVFSASKHLWLGSLGHDASETLIRSQLERFGPIENFYFFPVKGFALVEFRDIMHAVKARECMHESTPWGSCLRVKFLDMGLGCRGAIDGAAVGASCHAYVGKVLNQWVKDEILQKLVKLGLRSPRMVIDLTSESALLLEFETAEEATSVMSHIRHHRKEKGYQVKSTRSLVEGFSSCHNLLVRHVDSSVSDEELINAFSQFGELSGWKFIRQSGCCLVDFRSSGTASIARSHLDGTRFGPSLISVEFRIPDNTFGSPTITGQDNPVDSSINKMSQLSSFFANLCAKYNLSQGTTSFDNYISRNYYGDTSPSSTLWIGVPDFASPFFTYDDLMSICSLAVGNIGSVSRLIRANTHRGSCWIAEFNCVDAAVTVLKNIRSCSGMFFQIEFRNSGIPVHSDDCQFLAAKTIGPTCLLPHDDSSSGFGSQPGKQNVSPFIMKSETGVNELVSPGVSMDNHGTPVQNGRTFQSTWPVSSNMERLEVSPNVEEKGDGIEKIAPNPSLQEGQAVSCTAEQTWMCKKPEIEMQMAAPGILLRPPTVTQGPSLLPPLIQAPPFLRPFYLTPNSNTWDIRGPNPPLPLSQIPPGKPPTSFHVNVCATAPLLPSPVTPIAQSPGSTVQHFDQMIAVPTLQPLASPPPPPPDMPPPLPPSPPPLPLSQPPSVPPPPSSPPPLQRVVESSNVEAGGHHLQYQWRGVLCKSGVHYCSIVANREETDGCKYLNAMPEPAEWPAKLDVTKRTDFRHVKSTFSSTPPNQREVCRLLPSAAADHKGLQDFISYLQQRECAGVIKIPAGKSIWARLLFILPNSVDICSMLGIAYYPVECLIGLVFPKEKNFEWL